jgi:predicted GIY-YIG superfamily endonuclease
MATHSKGVVMQSSRDTFKYELKRGNKVVYAGITDDFQRRLNEHSKDKHFTTMQKVGNKVTRQSARQWEMNRLETYRKYHNGNNPEYNKSNLGSL